MRSKQFFVGLWSRFELTFKRLRVSLGYLPVRLSILGKRLFRKTVSQQQENKRRQFYKGVAQRTTLELLVATVAYPAIPLPPTALRYPPLPRNFPPISAAAYPPRTAAYRPSPPELRLPLRRITYRTGHEG